MSLIDMNDMDFLSKNGWEIKSFSTLNNYTKPHLIDIIRCLEHNWSGEIWKCNLLQKRLENVCDYLKKQGVSLEKINKIIAVEGENRGTEKL